MRSAVVVAVDSRTARVADISRGNMKLPVSVLVLVAIQAALAKSLKQKNNQTSKRELLEGNFGEKKALLSKYAASAAPGVQYAEDINEELSDQSPAHQSFGARLPQIAKISDVLTGQGPPFEVAVANHLYAPVSVYQARLSSPTTFEIPYPAASQISYSNPKSYKPRKQVKEQKKPELPPKEVEQPRYSVNVPVYAVKQPRFRFESYPRPFAHGTQQSNPQNMYQQPTPQLFPVYDETNRYTGHVVPPQYLQQQGIIQIVPYDAVYDYVNMEDKEYANQESQEEIKPEAAEKPKLQAELPQPKPGYHNHPNGAISFASFTQGLPSKTQQEAALKSQPVEAQVQQQADQSSQIQSQQPFPSQFYPQNGQQQMAKEGLNYPPIFQQYLRQFQKFQPFEQEVKFRGVSQPSPQLMAYNVPVRQQPRNLNPLRQQLLVESPQQFLQAFQFQRIPAFKPMPQGRLPSAPHYQPTTTPPTTQESVPQFKSLPQPKPFAYNGQPAQNPIQFNQPIVPVLPQRHLTPLPPLKPNYNQSVKPLVYQNPPAFLPTPVLPLPTSTPKLLSAPDQVISSTTIHPSVNQDLAVDQEQKGQLIQQKSETPKPLEPEINYQSQPTVLPLQQISVTAQPTTYRPTTTYEPHLKHEQQSTPQPQYQSTVLPQPIQYQSTVLPQPTQYQSTVLPQPTQYQSTVFPQPTQMPPRHEVVIQQQEIKELILEPSSQPLDAHPHSHPQQQSNPFHQHEQELYQLQSQQHQNYLEQLQPQLYQQIVQELQTQQHQRDARQREESIQSQRQHHETPIDFQQYQNQQHSQPLQHQFLQQQVHSQQQQEQTQSRQEQSPQQIENKEYEEKLQLEPQNAIQQQLSTPQPSDEPQKEPELQSDDQQQTEPQTIESEEQTEPSQAPSESKPPAPNADEPFFGPRYPIFQQLYTQPQELLVHPEYGSPLGINSLPDVQYFGKYAESIFNGLQH